MMVLQTMLEAIEQETRVLNLFKAPLNVRLCLFEMEVADWQQDGLGGLWSGMEVPCQLGHGRLLARGNFGLDAHRDATSTNATSPDLNGQYTDTIVWHSVFGTLIIDIHELCTVQYMAIVEV